MCKKLFWGWVFCLTFSVSFALAQEKPPENPKPETREESRPVETPKQESRPVETSNNNSSSRNDSSSRNEDSRSERSSGRDAESNSSERNSRGKDRDLEKVERPSNNPSNSNDEKKRDNSDRRDENNRNNEQDKKRDHDNDPNNRNDDRNRDKDKKNRGTDEDKRDEEYRRRKQEERRREEEYRRRNQDIYFPTPPTFPTNTIYSVKRYFNKGDVVYYSVDKYLETDAEKYLPYFLSPLNFSFEPLYPTYFREFFPNEFPFVAQGWVMYYETQLDDFFIDFSKLGNTNFERMVLLPIGEMAKKVAKKLDKRGQESRPTIVETIPSIKADKIYSFNLSGLPKGEYEMRLIARDGTTVRKIITIK